MPQIRNLRLIGATGEIRTAQYDGREHLVVPVVAMVEGVVWAVNSEVPEFVPAEELAETPQQWNGRGCFAGHPRDQDTEITANTPRTLEKSFGIVFGASSVERILKTRRLELQAWLDPTKAEAVGPEAVDVIRRLRANERVEVSVGCYVEAEQKDGEHGGKAYHSVWRNIVSDHLAFLAADEKGACSIAAGCGAPRTAIRHLVTAEGIRAAEETVRVKLNDAQAAVVKSLPESGMGYQRVDVTFLDGHTLADVKVYNAEEIELPSSHAVTPITAITLHAAAAREGTMPIPKEHARSLRERFMSLLPLIRDNKAEPGVSDAELRGKLSDALRAVEPGFMGVYAVYPADNLVIYEVCPEDDWKTMRRSYTTVDGKVTLGDTSEEVEAVVSYEPVTTAAEKPTAVKPPVVAADCGCKGDKVMDVTKKAELIAALITDQHSGFKEGDEPFLNLAPDERLETFQAAAVSRKAAAESAVKLESDVRAATAKVTVLENKLKDAEKPRTEEQIIADLERVPALKTLLDNQKQAEAAERETLITSLKACGADTEEELKGKKIEELRTLAKYAQVTPVADYSGRAVPRQVAAAASDKDAYAPPDPYKAGLEAMRAGKTVN